KIILIAARASPSGRFVDRRPERSYIGVASLSRLTPSFLVPSGLADGRALARCGSVSTRGPRRFARGARPGPGGLPRLLTPHRESTARPGAASQGRGFRFGARNVLGGTARFYPVPRDIRRRVPGLAAAAPAPQHCELRAALPRHGQTIARAGSGPRRG